MNKYLEKIAAGKLDKSLSAVLGWGDRILGHSAGKAKNTLRILRESTSLGGGIPQSTLRAAEGIAKDQSKKSLHTRINTGLVTAGVGTAGYLGIHKYQQHKDNQIMKKLLQNTHYNGIDS